jgi:hypothetical protein
VQYVCVCVCQARIKAKPLVRSTFPSQAGGIKTRPAVQFEDANTADVAYNSQAKFMPPSPPVYAPMAAANVHYVQVRLNHLRRHEFVYRQVITTIFQLTRILR